MIQLAQHAHTQTDTQAGIGVLCHTQTDTRTHRYRVLCHTQYTRAHTHKHTNTRAPLHMPSWVMFYCLDHHRLYIFPFPLLPHSPVSPLSVVSHYCQSPVSGVTLLSLPCQRCHITVSPLSEVSHYCCVCLYFPGAHSIPPSNVLNFSTQPFCGKKFIVAVIIPLRGPPVLCMYIYIHTCSSGRECTETGWRVCSLG